MSQLALNLPVAGLPNSTEDAKVIADFTLIQNVINGNLDSGNIAASLGQAASVNVAGQTVKGATNIATSESRSNVAYGTLTTPDQVSGIALPVNGLIAVWYQAMWQESVGNAARAAIFLNGNQLKAADQGVAAPVLVAAQTANSTAAINAPLTTATTGLVSTNMVAVSYSGDVTTGQVVGLAGGSGVSQEVNGSPVASTAGAGPCYIFAAAGTYAVSVQFKASSGSVTASNRRLWVQALSFA